MNEATSIPPRKVFSLPPVSDESDDPGNTLLQNHRKVRGKALLTSPLENIIGIGKKRRLELLRFFGSIENIKNATIETIAGIKGFNRRIAENLLRELGS